jgi:hypothetical protein
MRDLRRIPCVGLSLAQDLADLGIRRVTDSHRCSLERLYQRLCTLRGAHIDRCVLYVFRCAVYFASEPHPDPERLKWWNWKDSKTVQRQHSGEVMKASPITDILAVFFQSFVAATLCFSSGLRGFELRPSRMSGWRSEFGPAMVLARHLREPEHLFTQSLPTTGTG